MSADRKTRGPRPLTRWCAPMFSPGCAGPQDPRTLTGRFRGLTSLAKAHSLQSPFGCHSRVVSPSDVRRVHFPRSTSHVRQRPRGCLRTFVPNYCAMPESAHPASASGSVQALSPADTPITAVPPLTSSPPCHASVPLSGGAGWKRSAVACQLDGVIVTGGPLQQEDDGR